MRALLNERIVWNLIRNLTDWMTNGEMLPIITTVPNKSGRKYSVPHGDRFLRLLRLRLQFLTLGSNAIWCWGEETKSCLFYTHFSILNQSGDEVIWGRCVHPINTCPIISFHRSCPAFQNVSTFWSQTTFSCRLLQGKAGGPQTQTWSDTVHWEDQLSRFSINAAKTSPGVLIDISTFSHFLHIPIANWATPNR